MMLPFLLLVAYTCVNANGGAGQPNIIFILTDDQDQMLGGSFPTHGGATPLPTAQTMLVDQGAMANNWFIHTPICCPSRAELLTGRYFHNVKDPAPSPECDTGYGANNCCMHVDETRVNNQTLAFYLANAGYSVGMFGKYLNTCPDSDHVPAGFSAYLANGGGDYFSPQFYCKNLKKYGFPDGSYQGGPNVYSTSVIGNTSLAWLKDQLQGDKPVLAYIAPKAAHEPFQPAPWYADYWSDTWPEHEPRPVSYNCSPALRTNHHYTVASEPMISPQAGQFITQSFKDRWRTLMSVDDIIKGVFAEVEAAGQMNNTYFVFTSDHGFQLGEFNILIDKRQIYEYNIRIHMLIRGPGIAPNSTFDFLGTNVDVAPSFLGLAGVAKPAGMDGKSVIPLLVNASDPSVPRSVREHIASFGVSPAAYRDAWRDSIFVEYYYVDNNTKCEPECHNTEDFSNNFIGIRHLDGLFGNSMYAEFQNSVTSNIDFSRLDFVEYYNISADPWQMNNLWPAQNNTGIVNQLHDKLHLWLNCAGASCP